MSNPGDKLDAWLNTDVEPLMPPPGTFGRIRRRAGQRRRRQLMISSAAAVTVIAAAAALPQLVSALRPGQGPASTPAASGRSTASLQTTSPTPSTSPSPLPTASSGSPPALSSWTDPTGLPVAGDFRPSSITLVGPTVAAVLGQARCVAGPGPPGQCTSLAATTSEGAGWYGWPAAPSAGPPSGSAGVSQLRFLNTRVGWAFGPALQATVDGGTSWIPEAVPGGQRVLDLETAGDHAFALLASCAGRGSDYAAGCTRFSLYTSAADSTSWQPVAVPAGYRDIAAAEPGGTGSLVLASGTIANPNAGFGYLLTPSGALLSGGLSGGRWQLIGQIPRDCRVGTSQPDGQPAGVQLATGSVTAGPQLVLSCDGPAGSGSGQAKTIYTSYPSPTPVQWTRTGSAPGGGIARSLAAADGGLVVLATSTGIDYSGDSGASWSAAGISSPPPGGFSYVGMTTSSDGVAVPADAALGEVFITTDGGQSWTPSRIAG